jgi:hypothetical protein
MAAAFSLDSRPRTQIRRKLATKKRGFLLILRPTSAAVPPTSTATTTALGILVAGTLHDVAGWPLNNPAVQAVQEIVCQPGHDLAPQPSQARSNHRQHPGSQGNGWRPGPDRDDVWLGAACRYRGRLDRGVFLPRGEGDGTLGAGGDTGFALAAEFSINGCLAVH